MAAVIELKLDRASKSGRFIIVRDEGIGIPPREYRPICSRLFVERATSVTVSQAPGFGLAVAKQALELHGGDIRVVIRTWSTEGTTFQLAAATCD